MILGHWLLSVADLCLCHVKTLFVVYINPFSVANKIHLPALKNFILMFNSVFENRLSCQPSTVFKWLALLLCTHRGSCVRILACRSAVLTEVFGVFLQSLQADTGIIVWGVVIISLYFMYDDVFLFKGAECLNILERVSVKWLLILLL